MVTFSLRHELALNIHKLQVFKPVFSVVASFSSFFGLFVFYFVFCCFVFFGFFLGGGGGGLKCLKFVKISSYCILF